MKNNYYYYYYTFEVFSILQSPNTRILFPEKMTKIKIYKIDSRLYFE